MRAHLLLDCFVAKYYYACPPVAAQIHVLSTSPRVWQAVELQNIVISSGWAVVFVSQLEKWVIRSTAVDGMPHIETDIQNRYTSILDSYSTAS
jgi:hypothetical protein